LGETDRNAIVLRFFENKTSQEVAATLKLNEAAAHKRVSRAVEKLRKFFTKRGVTLSATLIVGAVSANSVQAAPVGLAASVAATAAKGTLISATITTLVQGTMKTMTWLKLKFAVGVSVAVVLAGGVATLATLATANKTSEEQSAPPTGNHAGATFFSVLERTPIVANAVFEKELFMDGVPAQARKQTFTFLADGDNYRLSTSGIEMGKFEGISWQQQNGYLVLFDPKINQRDGNSGGVVEGESICKMTVDLFLALGIKEMLPGSAVWDQDKQRFTAKTKDGKDLVVETTLKNGVPAIAYILTEDGQKYQKIQFRYSPGFYSGQVPTEFTAYWIKPGAKTEQPNDQKIYSIRVKTLEISDEHLDQALLDPIQLAATSAAIFYSNNIEYSIGKAGKVSRVLTAEEYAAEIKKLQGNK
jgi:guanyl-specific ribonuclease Sa